MLRKYFRKSLQVLVFAQVAKEATETCVSAVKQLIMSGLFEQKHTSEGNRHIKMSEHEAKARANQEFTRKLQQERREREEYARLRREQRINQLLGLKPIETSIHLYMSKHIEEAKQKKLEDIQQKAAARKAYLHQQRVKGDEAYREAIHTVPLFKKIEHRYQVQVQMPELERKKAELAKKRSIMQPVALDTLQEHARKYDQLKTHMKHKGSAKDLEVDTQLYLSSLPKTHFRQQVLEQEKARKITQLKKEQTKRLLVEKKKNYSKLVSEIFKPTSPKIQPTPQTLTEVPLIKRPPKNQLSPATNSKTSARLQPKLTQHHSNTFEYTRTPEDSRIEEIRARLAQLASLS